MRSLVSSLTLIALLLGACTSSPEKSPGSSSGNASGPSTLKVMTFNIEYGGEEVDFDSVIKTIERSEADVIGIEEAWGNIPRIASRLGWHYDPRMQIVSRYPLLAPPGSDGLYTYVEVSPGRVVAIGNVHLPSGPYGPFKVRDGATAKDVLALERRVRLPAVQPFLDALSRLTSQGVPAFLVGDFNAPSALDWTKEAVGIRDHVEFALEWPVSEALEKAGFQDSYREAHPDPVKDPGITWPAARPFVKGYNPARNRAPADRIDFVYAAGPVKTIDSALVGERGAAGVDISVAPWPTDHRGVLSTFEIEAAEAPTLVTVEQRLVDLGDEVRVHFHSPGEEGEEVVVVPADDDPGAETVAARTGSPRDGTVVLSSQGWQPGAYEALLVTGAGDELSRARFWIRKPGTEAHIDTAEPVYKVGQPIEVRWSAAPGNRWDWVGIYRRGADPNVASYILWLYTDASIEGVAVLDESANGSWPLKRGEYSVYLLEDDSYAKLAGSAFAVR